MSVTLILNDDPRVASVCTASEGHFRHVVVDVIDGDVFPLEEYKDKQTAIDLAKDQNQDRNVRASRIQVYDDKGSCVYAPE